MKINRNTLARSITLTEGKHQSVSIAQVKEILRLALQELAACPPSAVLALLERILEPPAVSPRRP